MKDKKIDLNELIEKGKAKGYLSQNEIMEAMDGDEFDFDHLDKIYEELEKNGIDPIDWRL